MRFLSREKLTEKNLELYFVKIKELNSDFDMFMSISLKIPRPQSLNSKTGK